MGFFGAPPRNFTPTNWLSLSAPVRLHPRVHGTGFPKSAYNDEVSLRYMHPCKATGRGCVVPESRRFESSGVSPPRLHQTVGLPAGSNYLFVPNCFIC